MTREDKHREYIEELADFQILLGLKQRPGEGVTSTEIKRMTGTIASDNSIIEALNYLEAGGAVVSFRPTPEKPKRWAAL